jgi:hypothetical protein
LWQAEVRVQKEERRKIKEGIERKGREDRLRERKAK